MTLKQLQDQGFDGIDASLETSLFEYGLVWSKTDRQDQNEYKVIFGVGYDEDTCEFDSFDMGFITESEFESMQGEDWFNLNQVLDFIGCSSDDCTGLHFPEGISDAISYHGAENILGSSYSNFKVGK